MLDITQCIMLLWLHNKGDNMTNQELRQHISELFIVRTLAEKLNDIERLSTIDDEIAEAMESLTA